MALITSDDDTRLWQDRALRPVLPPSPVSTHLRRRLGAGDVIAAAAGWCGVLTATGFIVDAPALTVPLRLPWALLAITVTMVSIVAQNLYATRVCAIWSEEFRRLSRSTIAAAAAIVGVEQLVGANLPLRDVSIAALVTLALLATNRALFRAWLRRQRLRGNYVRDLVLVGADADAAALETVIEEHAELGYRVCGYVGDRGPTPVHAPRLGALDTAARAVSEAGATGALVAAGALDPRTLNRVVRHLLAHDVRVHLSSGLRGIAQHRFRAMPLAHEPLFFIEPTALRRRQLVAKRAIDVVGATALLAVTAPIMAVAALAIRLDSPGPALFRQQRAGRDGDMFTMLKLRTMVIDAEDRLADLSAHNQRGGPLFKMAGDPRVTRVGRWLRTTSIDELPQLYNVLRGSMSLVGPRPALPWEMAAFDEQMRLRTQVAPGLTGLWQVEARDNPAYGPFRRLDLFYVENWSPALDLRIIAATAAGVSTRVFRMCGARSDDRPPRTVVLD